MLYYQDDFILDTNLITTIIQNLFLESRVTVNSENMVMKDTDTTFNMRNFHDLGRLAPFIQSYYAMSSSFLQIKVQKRERSAETGRMERVCVENFSIEDMIAASETNYSTSNYELYIEKAKASERRYNAATNELDHVSERKFFNQLCIFRYLYGHYFTSGLSPLSTDRLYFAFRNAFCPNCQNDNEGLADAIIKTAELNKFTTFKRDVLIQEIRIPSAHLDQALQEREAVIQQYIDREATHKREIPHLEKEQKVAEHRRDVGQSLLSVLAHMYALGFQHAYDNSSMKELLFEVKTKRRDLRAHDPATFFAIFSPTYFEYPGELNGFKSLKDNYKSEDFFIIIGEILEKCHSQRDSIKGAFGGTFKHKRGGFQYDTLAKSVLDILNTQIGNYVLYLNKDSHLKFTWDHFRHLPPTFSAFEYDYPTAYRRAFEVIENLAYAKGQLASIYQQTRILDQQIWDLRDEVNEKIDATAQAIAESHQEHLHKKILRRLSSSQHLSQEAKKQRLTSTSSSGATAMSSDRMEDNIFLSRQVNLKRRTSLFKEKRALQSHTSPAYETKYGIVDELTGEEDDDFLTCLTFILKHSGNYGDLIEIRNLLYKTYLARETTMSIHVTWTGNKRRRCTRFWAHLERIIQILVLTNMICRNVKIANITRICDHYFFLIMDRHSAIIIKEHRKKVCGMAERYFSQLRKKDEAGALDELNKKWERYVDLYSVPPMNTMDVLAKNREIGRSHFPSICEELEEIDKA